MWTNWNIFPVALHEDLLSLVEEIQWLMENLDTSKSNGPDGISVKMLKITVPSIALSITNLFNVSIQTGYILSSYLDIVLVSKSNSHPEPSNYRPILLPILGKLIEHHIHFLIST